MSKPTGKLKFILIGLVIILAVIGAPAGLFGLALLSSGGSQASACTPARDTGTVTIGAASGSMDLFQAIKTNAAGDVRLAAALLVGSYLESGWNPKATSQDGAFGAFQIQSPGVVHPDVSVDEALDPVFATNYMLGAYQKALRTVDPAIWVIDPERAAATVAYKAERPKYTYYEAQGASKVASAFQATVAKMQELGLGTNFGNGSNLTASPGLALDNGTSLGDCSASYTGVSITAYGPAVQAVLDAAKSQLGYPYVFGGGGTNGPSRSRIAMGNFNDVGYDCSGFTQYSFGQAGIELPRTARTQWLATADSRIPIGQEQPGDLVFFGSYLGKTNGPGHVGIVLDPSKKLMYAAPQTGDVTKVSSYDWGDDLMGFGRPYPPAETTPPTAEG